MAAPIGALRAEMSAGWGQFKNDFMQAKKAVQDSAAGMKKSMAGAQASFERVGTAIKAMSALAITAGVALGVMIKGQIDAADKAQKTAQSIGMTVDKLTALQYAADMSGVSQEQLTTALTITAKNAALAAEGTGSAADAYAELGISVKDADGKMKASNILIDEVADKFAKMPDGVKKTSLAVQLFGRQGAAMIPMLNEGSQGIKTLTDEARVLGIVLDTETAQAAEQFNDNLTRLKGVQQGFTITLMREMLPTLEKFSDHVVEAAKETNNFAGIAKFLNGTLQVLIATGYGVVGLFQIVGKTIAGVASLVPDVFNAIIGRGSWNKVRQQLRIVDDDLNTFEIKWEKKIDDILGKTTDGVREPAKNAGAAMADGLAEGLDKGAAEKLKKRGEDLIIGLQRELALIRDASREGAARYDLTLGKDKDLSEFHKRRIMELAKELDAQKALKEAEDARRAIVDEIIKEFDALRYEMGTIGMTADEIKLYNLSLKGATEGELELAAEMLQGIKVKKQVAEVLNMIRTPMEDYMAKVRMLSDLLAAGAISQDEFTAAVKVAKDALKEAAKVEKEEFKALGSMIDGVTSDGVNAIMEFARTGEFTVRKMVDAMIQDLLRLSLQQAATSLAGGLKNVLGVAVTAIGGFLTSAKGNVFDMGEVVPFAKGGVVAKQVMFPMGRGFGTMGEAGPEAVMPLTRTATGELGVRADVRGDDEAQAVNNYFVINSPDAEGFDRLCQRNAVSIVRATNAALEKNVGRNQMKGLLSG